MKYDGTMIMPRNHTPMTYETMENVEGGNPIVIAAVGVTVTISIFTWGQGEKDAQAWTKKYGKSKATSIRNAAAAKFALLIPLGLIFSIPAASYIGGYTAQLNRM